MVSARDFPLACLNQDELYQRFVLDAGLSAQDCKGINPGVHRLFRAGSNRAPQPFGDLRHDVAE
jgi:hypothetical protein